MREEIVMNFEEWKQELPDAFKVNEDLTIETLLMKVPMP